MDFKCYGMDGLYLFLFTKDERTGAQAFHCNLPSWLETWEWHHLPWHWEEQSLLLQEINVKVFWLTSQLQHLPLDKMCPCEEVSHGIQSNILNQTKFQNFVSSLIFVHPVYNWWGDLIVSSTGSFFRKKVLILQWQNSSSVTVSSLSKLFNYSFIITVCDCWLYSRCVMIKTLSSVATISKSCFFVKDCI